MNQKVSISSSKARQELIKTMTISSEKQQQKWKLVRIFIRKYIKREQTPSVSENAVQEDLRKLRRMQVFMCAALAMTLLIAAATFVFVIMMKWSRNKDLNASNSMVQGKSQWTIYTLSLLEICRKSKALHELSLKIVYYVLNFSY